MSDQRSAAMTTRRTYCAIIFAEDETIVTGRRDYGDSRPTGVRTIYEIEEHTTSVRVMTGNQFVQTERLTEFRTAILEAIEAVHAAPLQPPPPFPDPTSPS